MKTITPNTRISELIKANDQSITAIASLSKPLEKLKNPFLRKVLVGRVSISDAARMGGCTLSDFKRVLEPLGFSLSLETDEQLSLTNQADAPKEPVWLDKATLHTQLDVRQTIASGHDPLKEIHAHYRQLPLGQTLCIINSFIPHPVIHLLEKKGAKTFIEQIDTEEYHTYFFKEGVSTESMPETQIATLGQQEFHALLHTYPESDIIHLDVRELPMPQPMEHIVETLPELDNGKVLYVRHRRVPLHLLEEMENYAFCIKLCGVSENDVRLLIYRQP